MIKINEIYIRINTEDEKLEFRDQFNKGLNIVTSYINTKGKSTIGEAILFNLGLEEILGNKNERAIKPVLRSIIKVNDVDKVVLQSDIYLEIENGNNKVITILRSPNNNSRNVKLVSVYENTLDEVLKGNCKFNDYFVHDGGAAKNVRGFHHYLNDFAEYNIPNVATYDGREVPLYIQTIASCFYVEQKKGWMNILATMPTIYRIKDSKKRVLEYVLNLSVLETEKQYYFAEEKVKENEREWEQTIRSIISRVKRIKGFIISGLKEKPYLIQDNEKPIISYSGDDENIGVEELLRKIDVDISGLNNLSEPIIENQSNAMNRELNELGNLLNKFSDELDNSRINLAFEEDQLTAIINRLDIIKIDLSENRDLRKILKMGSLEKSGLVKSSCPTCGQNIDDTLFEQDSNIKVMTIDESIKHLENEKKMLEFSYKAQNEKVKSYLALDSQLQERTEVISSRIRLVKSDLISNNKAISKSHINKIVRLEIEKEQIKDLLKDVDEMWNQLICIGKNWSKNKLNLDKLPKDFICNKDRETLGKLRKEFIKLLTMFKFESISVDNIDIDFNSYMPIVNGFEYTGGKSFDLHSDSSASDTIRIMWAYLVALHRVANISGNNLGFFVLDEPAQQNADISSAKVLLNELKDLSCDEQIFVFYKREHNDSLLDELEKNSYKHIHSDEYLIK
jgi:hypothetical protein